MPAAVTRTSTSVAISSGRSISWSSRTSGPPSSRITTAFMKSVDHPAGRAFVLLGHGESIPEEANRLRRIEVHHLNCGTMCPRGARLLAGSGGLLETTKIVAHCLLIEAGGELILVDTGFGLGDCSNP